MPMTFLQTPRKTRHFSQGSVSNRSTTAPRPQPTNTAREAAAGEGIDYSSDPILQKVRKLAEIVLPRLIGARIVAGYHPLTEPADPRGEVIGPFYERLERAIRPEGRVCPSGRLRGSPSRRSARRVAKA